MPKRVIGIVLAICAFAVLVPNLNAQTSVLHEEFEGTFPPSGWTTTNTGGNNQWFTNSYWSRTNYAGGTGDCADCDDDRAGIGAPWCRNNALVTPSMDLSTATEVWLAYTLSYNNLSTTNEEARIEVYDGESWQNVVTYTSDQDAYGPGQRDSFDISSYAAGVSDVQVRFVYNEINSAGWYWWLEIDNVDVWADVGGGPKPPFVDTLFCEYFEGRWLPSGWTQIINNTRQTYPGMYATWYHGNYSTLFHHGSWGAYIWWNGYLQNEWLITFPIDLTGYDPGDSVDLRLNSAFYQNWPASWPGANYIKVSDDGGDTWDEIVDLTTEYGGSGWTYIDDYPNPLKFRISQYIGENIMIAFHYNAPSGGYAVWSVDDVCLIASGGGGGGPGEDSLDLAIEAIIRPKTKEEPNVPFTPEILVLNNLDTTAHALMRCKIKNRETGEQLYEDILSVVPIEPGENFIDAFDDFTPEGGKKYNALFVLEHPDDINEANNHLDKNFETEVGIDVTPYEIVLPDSLQEGPFHPAAMYAEQAGAETVANLIHTIEDMALHAIVASDTIFDHTFAANDTFEAEFEIPTGLAGGTYMITFWAENPLDGSNISFPPISKTFEYVPGIAETPVPERTSLEVLGTTVNFSLANATNVSIRVYDVAGKLVATLVEGSRDAGYYNVHWNTADVASGVYFVKMLTPEFSASGKMVVLY